MDVYRTIIYYIDVDNGIENKIIDDTCKDCDTDKMTVLESIEYLRTNNYVEIIPLSKMNNDQIFDCQRNNCWTLYKKTTKCD